MKRSISIFGVIAILLTIIACNRYPDDTIDWSNDTLDKDLWIIDTIAIAGPNLYPFDKYSLNGDVSKWPNTTYNFGEPQWTNLAIGSGAFILINSDSEMSQYVSGEYEPIDFSEKTLILAYGAESHYELIDDVYCYVNTGISVINVRIIINYGYISRPAFYFWGVPILVDKINRFGGSIFDPSPLYKVKLEVVRNYATGEE